MEIVFKNLASRPFSLVAPQGARYVHTVTRSAVLPNQTHTYRWHIHRTAGPGKADPACIVSAYLSDNDIYKDTNTGLVGPLVVCRRGTLDNNNKRTDVDREFTLLFTVTDENHSWLELKDQKGFSLTFLTIIAPSQKQHKFQPCLQVFR